MENKEKKMELGLDQMEKASGGSGSGSQLFICLECGMQCNTLDQLTEHRKIVHLKHKDKPTEDPLGQEPAAIAPPPGY